MAWSSPCSVLLIKAQTDLDGTEHVQSDSSHILMLKKFLGDQLVQEHNAQEFNCTNVSR